VVNVQDNVLDVQKDIINTLDEEIETIQIDGGEEQKEFLTASQFQLELEPNVSVTLKKNTDNTLITIKWNLPGDEEEDMEDTEEQAPNPEEEEEGEEKFQPPSEQIPPSYTPVSIELERIIKGKPEILFLDTMVGKDRQFYIESIRHGDANAPRLYFRDISEPLQDKFYTYMDRMGVSERTTNFILDYTDNFKGKRAVDTLTKIRNFMDAAAPLSKK